MKYGKFIILFSILFCTLFSCAKGEHIMIETTPGESILTDEAVTTDETTIPNETTTPGETTIPDDIIPPDDNKNITKLVSVIYDDLQLSAIADFEGTMDGLNELYSIECVRKIEFDRYRVSYLGEDKVATVIFDVSGNKLMSWVYRLNLLKSDFEGLKVGQTLSDVQNVDPNGYYWFLSTGTGEPRISDHFTNDGYLISIEYDENCNIIDIVIELI